MEYFKVRGKNKLEGSLTVQGAKNSALPILAATLLIKDKSIIHNCPELSDVDAAIRILKTLGCICVRDEHTVIVDAADSANFEIGKSLMEEMRSSIVFLGAVISRNAKAVLSGPGGCELGPRPIDMHLSALRQMGVEISENEGTIICSAPNGIKGAKIKLRFPSVGATENIIITAAVSKGTTVIHGAAKEPEISDLADFLNASGAKIRGAGSSVIVIEGVEKLHSAEHTVISDRIVAATYLSAAAATGGEILLKNCPAYNMISVLEFYKAMGCSVNSNSNRVHIKAATPLKMNSSIVTGVYPLFPTDAGPIAVAAFPSIDGINGLTETIFENRFRYVPELNKFGADIKIENQTAVSLGRKELFGAKVNCTDLRGGAALVVAALSAQGESEIYDIHHIERGYCRFADNLRLIGAQIKEMEMCE